MYRLIRNSAAIHRPRTCAGTDRRPPHVPLVAAQHFTARWQMAILPREDPIKDGQHRPGTQRSHACWRRPSYCTFRCTWTKTIGAAGLCCGRPPHAWRAASFTCKDPSNRRAMDATGGWHPMRAMFLDTSFQASLRDHPGLSGPGPGSIGAGGASPPRRDECKGPLPRSGGCAVLLLGRGSRRGEDLVPVAPWRCKDPAPAKGTSPDGPGDHPRGTAVIVTSRAVKAASPFTFRRQHHAPGTATAHDL